MKRIDRILDLYNLLKQSPHRMDQLIGLPDTTVRTSREQVYRDFKEIKKLAESRGEQLVQTDAGQYNRKAWKIEPITTAETLSAQDLDTYLISRAVLPGVFAEQRIPSLKRLQHTIQQQAISSKAIKYKPGVSEQTFTNSHFYENRVTKELDSKLTDMLSAVSQQQSITITELTGDATAVRIIAQIPLEVTPIKLLFHRGCFYVATITRADERVLVFQIDQLTWMVDRLVKNLRRLRKRVDDDLKNRFGVTQNYNAETYTIRLLFSETTGKFVGEQQWHHSQQIEPINMPTGEINYLLTLRCGINRELVGWLFQWMGNVRVLGPPALIDLYNKQLARINTLVTQPDQSLAYSNIFAPAAAENE